MSTSIGFLDKVSQSGFSGWMIDSRVNLVDIYVNDYCVGSFSVDKYREDLKLQCLSEDGKNGFEESYSLKEFDIVKAYIHKSNIELKGSPKYVLPDRALSIKLVKKKKLGQALLAKSSIIKNLSDFYSHEDIFIELISNDFGSIVGLCFFDKNSDVSFVELYKSQKVLEKTKRCHELILTRTAIPHLKLHQPLNDQNVSAIFPFFEGQTLTKILQHQNFKFDKHFAEIIIAAISEVSKATSFVRGILGFKQRYLRFFLKNISLFETFFRSLIKQKKIKELFLLVKVFSKLSIARTEFSHGDLHPGNIMINNQNDPVIIDWDSYGFMPVGHDIAYLVKHSKLDFKESVSFIKQYIEFCNRNAVKTCSDKQILEQIYFLSCKERINFVNSKYAKEILKHISIKNKDKIND
jgi:thiamine kinase-like enzyme